MYRMARPPSGLVQINHRRIGESIALLLLTTLNRVLIDALPLLFRCLQKLADPAPELAATASGPIAEPNAVG